MKNLKEWTIGKVIPFQGPPQANSFRSVAELKEIIENSGLYDRSGRFQFVPRFYTGNTLTFPLNPNPDLFADSSKMTIARYTLEFYIPELANGLPSVGGFYVDSMGLWGNFLNYRRDHFTYARHTLGTDAVGNPVLPNVLSHYEYLSELGQRLHARGKVLFANGIHEGSAKTNRDGRSDHDASRNTSRFFLAAVSDIGGSEAAAQMQRMELLRIMMGPKPYSTIDEKPMDATALIRYS